MTEQRQHARYQVEFPAIFEGDHAGIGIVYNLGIGGCKVVSDLAVQHGALLTVQLHIPGESRPIVIDNAAVRWSRSAGIGLEFLTVAPPHQDRLDHIIRQLQPKTGAQ